MRPLGHIVSVEALEEYEHGFDVQAALTGAGIMGQPELPDWDQGQLVEVLTGALEVRS